MTFPPNADTYLMPYGLTSKGGEGSIPPLSLCFALCWHLLFYFSMLRLCTLCTSVSSDVIRSWPRISNKSRWTGSRCGAETEGLYYGFTAPLGLYIIVYAAKTLTTVGSVHTSTKRYGSCELKHMVFHS
jgi:hypothetical protein